MAVSGHTGWTYAEYARLPDDGNRYEVLDGEVLTTPAPGTRHQRVAAELFLRLKAYVEEHGLGEMMWDIDLLFVTGQFLRPDMLFVPESVRHGLTDRGMEAVPGLVVEVLSPHSGRNDKVKKPARYVDFGVPEYWVLEPQRRSILVWDFAGGATSPREEREVLRWQPEPSAPPLELRIDELFRERPRPS